jgi:hypothetical protein
MELKNLQQQFYDVLSQENNRKINQLSTLIKAPNNLEADDSITIYQDSINAQLIKTLKTIYPVCLQLVGDKFFKLYSSTVY